MSEGAMMAGTAVQETGRQAPGVYREVASQRPAPAFETGVPAFVGRVLEEVRGQQPFTKDAQRFAVVPLDRAAWSALEAIHGTAWAAGHLGFAVRGFFENGGQRCYVAPLGDEDSSGMDAVLAALEGLEDFDLVCAPDITPRLPARDDADADADAKLIKDQEKLLRLCERRTGCFAILDAIVDPLELLKMLRSTPSAGAAPAALQHASAALYAPWIKVRGAPGEGFVPPSGHVAGVYARTDRQVGVHKAPANELIEGALAFQAHFDPVAVGKINAAGLNCLRALPGRGLRIWGARTLAPQDPGFAFVNTRRVYLTVARWLELAAAELVFEPNDLRLWVRVGRDIGVFLEELFHRGALAGASPKEAFYVKCDAETNPREVREAGQLVIEVGLALTRPYEFVVVRLISGAEGARAVHPSAGR